MHLHYQGQYPEFSQPIGLTGSHTWRHSLSLTTDWAEIPPKEEKGGGEYQNMIKVRGRCMQHTHFTKFVADLLKVTTSHKENHHEGF